MVGGSAGRLLTREWFAHYAGVLAGYACEDADNIDADVRLGFDFDDRISFRSRQDWSDYALSHWSDVRESNIWQNRGVVRRALLDHRRSHVVLSVQANSTNDIEHIFEQVSEALSLKPSPINPYKYRRSSLEFEIGDWRPDAFVRGVQDIAALLGSSPDIPEAYAKSFEGDIEKVTSFLDPILTS